MNCDATSAAAWERKVLRRTLCEWRSDFAARQHRVDLGLGAINPRARVRVRTTAETVFARVRRSDSRVPQKPAGYYLCRASSVTPRVTGTSMGDGGRFP